MSKVKIRFFFGSKSFRNFQIRGVVKVNVYFCLLCKDFVLDHSGVSVISIKSPFNEVAVFWFTWHCDFLLFMAYFKVSVCVCVGGGDAVAQSVERKTHGQEVAGF